MSFNLVIVRNRPRRGPIKLSQAEIVHNPEVAIRADLHTLGRLVDILNAELLDDFGKFQRAAENADEVIGRLATCGCRVEVLSSGTIPLTATTSVVSDSPRFVASVKRELEARR